MELYQLEYFKAVSDSQGFTKAASEMNVSQPAISIAIKKLEEELGVSLFKKKDKPVALTSIGRAILKRTEQILMQLDNIHKEALEYSKKSSIVIKFGIPLTLCNDLLIPLKTDYIEKYPDVSVHIAQYGMEILEPELTLGNFDICILCKPVKNSELAYVDFRKVELYACFAKEHYFLDYDEITPKMLAGEELLIPDTENSISGSVMKYLSDHDEPYRLPRSGLYLPQVSLKFAERNMGIALLDKNFALQNKEIVCRPLVPPLEINLIIAWNRNKFVTKAEKSFVSYLLRQTRSAFS